MALELWQSSSPEIRDRWREIARSLRDPEAADSLAKALQTCFWFGASATSPPGSAKGEMTLRHLLPPERLTGLLPRAPRSRG